MFAGSEPIMIAETLAQVPWYRVTIGCNTFIFMLELYLEYRQISKMKKHGMTKQVCTLLSVFLTIRITL